MSKRESSARAASPYRGETEKNIGLPQDSKNHTNQVQHRVDRRGFIRFGGLRYWSARNSSFGHEFAKDPVWDQYCPDVTPLPLRSTDRPMSLPRLKMFHVQPGDLGTAPARPRRIVVHPSISHRPLDYALRMKSSTWAHSDGIASHLERYRARTRGPG